MIDAETKRVSRLVAIQTILQGKLLITASELAKRFEVSVRTIYRDVSGTLTYRTLEPFAILMSTQGNWLLVAWCGLRNGYRIFRLDRIEQLEVLTEMFTPHALTLKKYFEMFAK